MNAKKVSPKVDDDLNEFTLKPRPNHQIYLETLRKMTPEERLLKAFDLSLFSQTLFKEGLKVRFPTYTEEQIHELYLARLAKCYNRNY